MDELQIRHEIPSRSRRQAAPGGVAQDYFTPAEIGRFLGLSTYTIQEVCRRGEMRHVRFGRLIRIRRQWADQFMATRERQPLQ